MLRHSRTLKSIAAGLLLVLGGAIYIIFRSQTLLYRLVGEGWPWMNTLRTAAAELLQRSSTMGEFVVFSLPDGLWATAYILLMDVRHHKAPIRVRVAWAAVIPLIGAAAELLQALCPTGYRPWGINLGTFDVLDLVCYLAPLAIYILLQKFHTTS